MASLTAIVGATVIDGTGRAPIPNGVLLIEGEKIHVSGDSSLAVPGAAEIIDARGKFVIPGLMDANVHLVLDYFPLTLVRYEGRYDQLAVEAAQFALKNGVTTVFDTWGPRVDLIAARRRIECGEAVGARIFLAGNIVGFGGPLSDDFFPQGRASLFDAYSDSVNARWQEGVGPELMWMPPDRVAAAVCAHIANGIDFLKYGVTGHKSTTAHYIQFSPRVQAAIVAETRRAGITVQTHTTSVEGLHSALEAGVDILQHGNITGPEDIPDETLRLLAGSKTACALLAHTDKAMSWYRKRAQVDTANRAHHVMHEVAHRNDAAILKSGATVLLSTDSGIFSTDTLNSRMWAGAVPPEESSFFLGDGHFHWLLAMEQRGMNPMDALLAATRNIARAYGVADRVGTLEPGKFADLLVLDADPLAKAANYRTIATVMKAGAVIDTAGLPAQRLLTTTQ